MPPLPSLALIGAKRSGKDTAADYLRDVYGYRKLAFADPLRDIAERLNPIVGWWGPAGPTRYRAAVEECGYDDAKRFYPELRRFLQVLGTEAIRGVLGDDVWVDYLVKRVYDQWRQDPRQPLVITDVRFPNEADTLTRLGFTTVRILRPQAEEPDDHPSENALRGYPVDEVVWNDGPLLALYDALEVIVNG